MMDLVTFQEVVSSAERKATVQETAIRVAVGTVEEMAMEPSHRSLQQIRTVVNRQRHVNNPVC